jgi:hypothetical protein
MEFIQGKYLQLADSLFAPIWVWVMARSWVFRLSVFLLGGIIALVCYNPTGASENLHLGASIIKITVGADGSTLDSEKLISTVQRLDKAVAKDLTGFVGLEPWSIAQAIVAAGGPQETTARPTYAQKAISLIRNNKTNGCFCWGEYSGNKADGVCTFIAGWVMLAFSDLGEAISNDEVAHVLSTQNAEGWWPMFEDKTDAVYASTYSTAWMVLGLVEMNKRDLIPPTMRSQAEDAVDRGVSWLQMTRTGLTRWKAYPNLSNSEEYDSISGLVLHTLHVADQSGLRNLGLRDLDRDWLSSLPSVPPKVASRETPFVEMRGPPESRVDRFRQITLPWMLIATIDAYPSGTVFRKALASNWIDAALSDHGVSTADANGNNWERAELLYALKYVQRFANE